MSLLAVVLISAAILSVAYWTYGPVLARLLKLDQDAVTPAVELRDDVDYAPLAPNALLSQHFSAIAAAGPIVGPILACTMFGWQPALLWILIGAIFIGGVHDITALVASIRHKAGSIAEVVRNHMSQRSFLLFLTFVWLALVYIIVAFTDITALSFIGEHDIDGGKTTVTGAGIASSSLLYLALPIAMGLLLRYTRLSLGWATLIFLPLVGVAIWIGQKIPFDVEAYLRLWNPNLTPDDATHLAHKIWDVALLCYCFVASIVPLWILLQPRGHLGGYFLYAALGGGALGLIFGGKSIEFPAFTGWTDERGNALFPMLFIVIACGACSGFHSLIASGTTSKQLRKETDARIIGYGAMLLEAMVAVVSLCCVMILKQDAAEAKADPNFIYATGIGSFLAILGIPPVLGVSFAFMAFTTFVYDTLDVCTRLGRYIIQELTGWKGRGGRWLATALTAGVPLFFVTQTTVNPGTGKIEPAWRTFWTLFGASNQLLAALTLLGVTVWLWRTRRARWVWVVTGIPTVWMYVMSSWALVQFVVKPWQPWLTGSASFAEMLKTGVATNPIPWVALILVVLALLMLVEALRVLLGAPTQPAPPKETVPAAA